MRAFQILMIVTLCALAGFPSSPVTASPRQDLLPGPLLGNVLDVLDGDTLSVRVQVWIGQSVETHVRIKGLDTPEMRGKCQKERAKARAARAELQTLLAEGKIILSEIRLEKYAGRVLASAQTPAGVDIRSYLIKKGLARSYDGGKRESWCD